MKDKEKKEVLISTKVTPHEKQLFERIAKRIGLNGYSFLNLMVSSVLRYSDDRHHLDPVLEKAISIYEGFNDWSKMSSVIGSGKKEVVKAIYLVAQQGKRSTNAVLVDTPFFGNSQCTYNSQQILDEVLRSTSPKIHKRLQAVANDMQCNSIVETIGTLIDMHAPDPDDEYIRELFSDCRRSEFGRVVDQQRFVRHNNKQHE